MSDYEDIIPTEEVILERENNWLNCFKKYENLNDIANDATDISFEDILDYEEDKYHSEEMCKESTDDSDDENNLNENKDKILAVAEKRKKIFNEKGLFKKLNFFDQSQGHHSMNWMQSNFSQSFGFGHTAVSHHRQEISVFHYSNNSQMSFSNYFNNTSVMQTPNFYNPLLRNNSLQSINALQPIDQRELDCRQRSFSTDSFRKNDKNFNLRSTEDVKVNYDLPSSGNRNKENCQRKIHTSCDSSGSDNRSQHNNRIKKTTKNGKSKKLKESSIKAIEKLNDIFIISSESDSDLTVIKKNNGKKQNIHRSEINLAKNGVPTSEFIERDRVKISKKEVLNFDADKTLTEDDKMPPIRGRSQKEIGECFF